MAATRTSPVSTAYLSLLATGDPDGLLRSFETTPHIDDSLAGHVYGEDAVRRFAEERGGWLQDREAEVELVAETVAHNRTVSELLLHLAVERRRVALPVAVVGERAGGRPLCVADPGLGAAVVERTSASESVMHVRVYHSTWLLTGGHELRPALLAGEHVDIPDLVGRYQDALARGDLDAIVPCFEEDGYFREPSGGDFLYRGRDAVREAFAFLFSNEGGIPLEHCTLTDDGTRCAIEYNVVRWGKTDLPRQPGVAVYERGRTGLLAAARVYDDVYAPLG